MNELVSVIITTYSRTNTLKRAIESVINQTYNNIEIIVVDDNFDMHIREDVKKIISNFSGLPIHLICNKRNLGGALARNEGIKVAQGKYIAFLDDDDEYLPNKIERQYMLFKNSNDEKLALVYSYCREIKNNNNFIDYKYDYIGNCIYQAMVDCIAATSQWMCRKDALERVLCFSDVPCKQDSTVILKLLYEGYSIDRVPDILSIYHSDGDNRISKSSHEKRIIGEEKLRELCRNGYYRISSEQIKEVEYSFYTRLIVHYWKVRKYKKFFEGLINIIKHPFRKKTLVAIKGCIFD